MTIVKMHAPLARYTTEPQLDLSIWMHEHGVEHWHCYREGAFLIINFFGLEHEEDAIMFKLKFGC